MARSFLRKNKLAVISDLNVTPVIEQYNRVDLPNQQSTARQPPPPVEDKYITIDAKGSYFWGKEPVAPLELKSRLDQLSNLDGPVPTIHIRGDKSLPYQKVIDVVNLLKERNLTKLSLDTRAS